MAYSITTTTGPGWQDIVKSDPKGAQAALKRNNNNAVEAFNDYNNTNKQIAQTSNQSTASSGSASTARTAAHAGALEDGSSKQTFWEKATNSISGAATGAVNAANDAAGAAGESLGKLGKYETIAIKNLVGSSTELSKGINEVSSGIAGSISGATAAIGGQLQGWKTEMHEALKPVSTAIGSTAMMVENIAKDPLGAPQVLAQGAMALLDKVSPSLANELEGATKSMHLENLANLPGQMMGSLRSLTLAADALLSVPFTIVSDIYNGLMDIMEEIANLIDSVVSFIFDFFFGPGGLLDSILPISDILSMLEAIGQAASVVGDIASMAGGFNVVTKITGQITGAVSNISSMIQNPVSLAQSYIPGFSQVTGGISQVTGALRDPEQFVKGMLPGSISGQLNKISSIPGLGFVSNYGTSIGGTLNGLKDGVFTKALDNYSKQIPMLAPLMNQQSPVPSAINTQEGYSDSWKKSNIRPEQQLTNGGHVSLALNQSAPWKIFPEQSSPASRNILKNNSISGYGMTESKNPATGKLLTTGTVQGVNLSNLAKYF